MCEPDILNFKEQTFTENKVDTLFLYSSHGLEHSYFRKFYCMFIFIQDAKFDNMKSKVVKIQNL